MVRQLSRLRLLVTLAVVLVAIYRLGLRGWLARQEPWEWGLVAMMLVIFTALIAVQRVQQATLPLTIAWVAGGLAATGGFAWLCWNTWTHPASHNWSAIPVIGALAIFAFFVFWYPLLSNLSKSTRLINRLQRAVESSDANAERYLWEGRQVLGTGGNLKQMYLDAFEGKLHYTQGKPSLAVEPLERAVANALLKDDRTLGHDAARILVQVLVSLSSHDAAARWTDEVEERWGEAPEPRSAPQASATHK
jgi:hypothetical protein